METKMADFDESIPVITTTTTMDTWESLALRHLIILERFLDQIANEEMVILVLNNIVHLRY